MVMIQTSRQAQATDTLLDIRQLSVDYFAANGTVHAVMDVNLQLARGSVLGLAGESGSGKSTLAYAVARLLRPPAAITGGQILYYPRSHGVNTAVIERASVPRAQGRQGSDPLKERATTEPIDILKLTPAQLREFRWNELSIVFQSAMNALNPVLSVGEQIMDVLKAHRAMLGADARRQRAIELLRLVGIAPDRLKSYPHELSGGMRQRVTIAIALALNPELIIMDEPTTALDVVMQREILELITALCKEFGTALLFITHDLSLLLELADSIAIMYAGRIIEQASQFELYAHPRHPYSYGLLHSFPSLRGPRQAMTGIPGSPPDLRQPPAGCAFHPRCPLAFEQCRRVLPVLQVATQENPEQRVACHLYDHQLRPEGLPATEELAAAYQHLAERRRIS